MKIEYDHSKIEKDIQSKWNESNAFTAKIDNKKPSIQDLKISHNSITLVNGKLESFDFKSENLKDENFFKINEFHLDQHLNFANELKDNRMQNLNTALHEGGFYLNIKSQSFQDFL